MSVTRGRILGFDNERMTFGFTMINGEAVVECQISVAAIDELTGGSRGTRRDREAEFLRHREAIESIAIAKINSGTPVPGSIVRIFAKDVRK